jgi:hypothetical protein
VQGQIIPSDWIEMAILACVNLGKSAISSPWFYILLGVGILSFIYRAWKNSDPSDIELDTLILIVLWIAAGGAVTLLGLAGVFDHRYVRKAQTTLSIAGGIEDALGLIVTLVFYCVLVWYILRRSIILGILIGLLGGAGILYWDIRIQIS